VSSSKEPARLRAAVLILLSVLAVPAAARDSAADERRSSETALSRIRIDNFGRVNDSYYRGAQPKGGDYADLAALGIKTVINLTSDDAMDDEKAMAAAAGIAYVQIPMSTHKIPTAVQLAEFLGIVNDPDKQPVYVHCVGGRHRTGVMTAVYRMTRDGLSGDQAFKEMKQFKYGPDFLHPEFKRFVYEFDTKRAATTAHAGG
jgi:protein tyrosine/serine phosphatase